MAADGLRDDLWDDDECLVVVRLWVDHAVVEVKTPDGLSSAALVRMLRGAATSFEEGEAIRIG